MSRRSKRGEPRLPLVLTLVVATVIPLLPDELLPGPRWLFPVIILVLMTAMLILDLGRIDRRSLALRRLRIGIALTLAASTTYATVALANALVVGSAAIVEFGKRAPTHGRAGLDCARDHVHVRLLGARCGRTWRATRDGAQIS